MVSKRFLVIAGFLALAVAIAGFAWSQGPPVEPDTPTYKDSNQRLKEVEAHVPEFGGLFLSDEQSVLNIYLTANETDTATQEKAREKVEEWFDVKSGLRLNIIKGNYTITQLSDWYALMKSEGIWDQEGVIMLDLQEASNEIYIGVVSEADVEPVYTFLVGIGIPREAVTVERIEQVTSSSHSIQDRAHNDKMAGGYQIQNGNELCTLGFVAIRDGTAGFVTAGHCTEGDPYDGGVASTNQIHQPGGSNLVGFEDTDPSFSTSLTGCTDSDGCRHSDSAFIRFSSGVQYNRGWVAKPSSWWGVSVAPDTDHYSITSDSGAYAVGDEVIKVGRSTGKTKGDITHSCFEADDGTNNDWIGTYLCQVQVDVRALGGDSGSPVFKVRSGDNVTLVGILTHSNSSTYQFCPTGRIFLDLGSTNQNWDVCTSGC